MNQIIDLFLLFILVTLLITSVSIFMVRRGWLPPFFEPMSEPKMNGTPTEREKALAKYFRKRPEPFDDLSVKILLALGGLLAFFGVVGTSWAQIRDLSVLAVLVGALLASMGVFLYFAGKWAYEEALAQAEPKPTDAQLDALLNEELKRIKREALKKLDLLPEDIVSDPNDPIMVVGPATSAQLAVGQDGTIRCSAYEILVVYLTDYQLAAYQCTLNLVDGMITSESIQEYHYTDVVSVSTKTDKSGLFTVIVNGQKKPIASYQKFALSVASGEQIQVAISFPQLEHIIEKGKLAPTGAHQATKIIRAKLRDKKGGLQAA